MVVQTEPSVPENIPVTHRKRPELDNPTLLYSFNTCFAKTPKHFPFVKPTIVDQSPTEPTTHISSYRDDLSKFATAVSNASFVEKHGVADYIKLFQHCKLV